MVPPKNSTVNASQDVSLACRAEAYPANLTYSWFQDSTNVFHIRWGSGCGEVGCGEVGCGEVACCGDGELVGSLRSPLAEQGLEPSAPVPYRSRLQPRVRILVDGSLRLQAAQPDDAGRYTCVPSNGLPRPPSASAYLTVLCKPHPSSLDRRLHFLGPGPAPPLQLATASPRPSSGDRHAS